MDLLSVVVKPTWREFLVDLVQSRQMDPWDIDITAVADAYLQRVHELQALDLRVPANVILACALMLKFKAESISLEAPNDEPEEYYEETRQLIAEDIPELVYRANRARRRKVTLSELLDAVEQVMKKGPRQNLVTAMPRELSIDLPELDMDEIMARVYAYANEIKDAENLVTFKELVKLEREHTISLNGSSQTMIKQFDGPAERVVYYLLPVLHLAQDRKVAAWQDETFGEIFIKVLTEEERAQAAQFEAAAG